MKILTIHADYIEVEPLKKAIKDAEEIKSKDKKKYEEVLVVFTGVEEGDEDIEKSSNSLVTSIEGIAEQLKVKNILLYPLVHLISKPSSPTVAFEVIKKAEELLNKRDYTADHTPFGWYKGYTLKCKGHPLSELSRELKAEGDKGKIKGEEFSSSLDAKMETASHLVYETARKMLNEDFVSISEVKGNKSTLNWKGFKKKIDAEFIKKLEEEVNRNLEADLEVKIESLERNESLKKCGAFYDNVVPKKFKEIRVVTIATLPPEPCIHEHVSSTKKIGNKIVIEGFEKVEEEYYQIKIRAEMGKGEISEALKAEEKLVSHYYILDEKGKEHKIEYDKGKKKFTGYDFGKYENLKKFSAYEIAKDRIANVEPPHVKYMKKLELVDYEPGSDPGNLRYYPKGRFIKGLIERYVTQIIKKNGGMEVETPIMYDFEHPSLKSYLNRFPARQYTIDTPNKKVFLRFSACFGQFLMAHDANISYKQLPIWMYELTRYSFRTEQRGELTGLRRLRAFTMPDCHALCADEKQAKEELIKRFEMSRKLQEKMGINPEEDLELGLRVTKEFYEKNKEFVKDLVKRWEKPAFLEMWDQQFFYFVFKYEFNFIDSSDKASALTTDQIDVENAKRYGIEYTDKDGSKKNPLVLHLSPSGAVERIIYALLEKAHFDIKKEKAPSFPLWLAPTQVRLIPVSTDKHLKFCEELAEKLEKENIRVDIDERIEGVGKRIMHSGQEWISYTLVIGDNELKGKELMVRDREKGKDVKMKVEDLVKIIKKKTEGMPYDSIPLPRHLSKRIIFVG